MKISVVIPVRNRRGYLAKTVGSLLAEPLDLDIVVVDDGSTDGSLNTIRNLPVRTSRLAPSRGISRARNVGLALANGDAVTFFDSDDLLVPGGLCRRVEWLSRNPDRQAVGGTVGGHIDGEDRALPSPAPRPPPEISLPYYRGGGTYCCGPWLYLFRRGLLGEVGAFDESLTIASDSDLILRALARGPIPILPVPVLLYRRHAANLSFQLEGD